MAACCVDQALGELEDAVTEIQAQQAALRVQRDAIFTPLGEDIKKVYEHVVAQTKTQLKSKNVEAEVSLIVL